MRSIGRAIECGKLRTTYMCIWVRGTWRKCMTLRWFIGCAKRISRSSNNLVEQILIIEIKAGRAIALEHEAQILG